MSKLLSQGESGRPIRRRMFCKDERMLDFVRLDISRAQRYKARRGDGAQKVAIERVSAVTLAVRDMARSVAFYQSLGFRLEYGGVDASFTSLQAGAASVNLSTVPTYGRAWWGRAIFRVDDADAQYEAFVAAGLSPESPRDAAWGERFFHILDPDGHELSFAEVLPPRS